MADYSNETNPRRYRSSAFVHQLATHGIAQRTSPTVCWMISVIATSQNTQYVLRPIKLNDVILAAQCGFRTVEELQEHRQAAIAAGLLRCEPAESTGELLYWLQRPHDAFPPMEGN